MAKRRKQAVNVEALSLGGTKPPVGVTVGEMLAEMAEGLKLSAVEENGGLERRVRGAEINRPGLAIAGYFGRFSHRQIQVLGMTELAYLSSLTEQKRSEIFRKITSYDGLPCFIIARGRRPPPALKVAARNRGITVAISRLRTTDVVALLSDYLRDKFAPRLAFHGDLLDVYGVGILILGAAAVGKSECALDLLARGHRIIADDVVYVRRRITGELVGDTRENIREHIEIRGLGVLNVKELFGIRAVRREKNVEVVVKIELQNPEEEYDRTGLDRRVVSILGVEVPFITIPVVPGKNVSTLVEVAALNFLLKRYGYDAALVFNDMLRSQLRDNEPDRKKGKA
jgi:HPr kinase/phosphorylase